MYRNRKYVSTIAKIIISRLPGLSEKSSAVIGQFVITTAVRGVPKSQQTAVLRLFVLAWVPPSRELETNRPIRALDFPANADAVK